MKEYFTLNAVKYYMENYMILENFVKACEAFILPPPYLNLEKIFNTKKIKILKCFK